MTVLENVLVADKDARDPPVRLAASFRPIVAPRLPLVLSSSTACGSPTRPTSSPGLWPTATRAGWRSPGRWPASPSVLFLDEPAAGMNERETEELLTEDIRCLPQRLDAILWSSTTWT